MVRSSLGYHPGDRPIPGQGYKLETLLGVGQFGEVWKAEAPGGFEVALKLIDLTRQEGEREFAALRQLRQIRNPHLTPITASWILDEDGELLNESSPLEAAEAGSDVFAAETFGDDDPRRRRRQPARLIVGMGLGDKCLSARLKECTAEGQSGIPLEELLEYIEGAAKGLDYLHRPIHEMGQGLAPIIHRDIKPHNILVVGGEAQVCDFGLARAMPNLVASRTKTAVGTLAYMAPEVAQYRPATARSDQYSFAVTYFELRTGKLPFGNCDEPNVVDVVRAHESGKLKLHLLGPLERRAVAKATHKDPARRYTTCSEFVETLKRALEEERSRRGWFGRLFGSAERGRKVPFDESAEEFSDSRGKQPADAEKTSVMGRTPGTAGPEGGPEEPPLPSGSTAGEQASADTPGSVEVQRKPAADRVALKESDKSQHEDRTEPYSVVETLPHDSRPPRIPGSAADEAEGGGARGGTMVAPTSGRDATIEEESRPPAPPEAAEERPGEGFPRPKRRRRKWLGAALLAAVLAGVATVATQSDSVPEWYESAAGRVSTLLGGSQRIGNGGDGPTVEDSGVEAPTKVTADSKDKEEPVEVVVETKKDPLPTFERQISELVETNNFVRAMEVVGQAPAEEREALRERVRDAWRRHLSSDEWSADQLNRFASQLEQYRQRFPADNDPSSAGARLLLANWHMVRRGKDWEVTVSELLAGLQETGVLGTTKGRLIQLRFDIVRVRLEQRKVRDWLDHFGEYGRAKEKYLVEQATADKADLRRDPPQVGDRWQEVADLAISDAWKLFADDQLHEAAVLVKALEAAKEATEEVGSPASLPGELAAVKAVATLRDKEARAESVSKAIEVLRGYVPAGSVERVLIAVAALGEIAVPQDDPLLETRLGDAIDLIRRAEQRVNLPRHTAPPKARLWERRVQIWLSRPSPPQKDELVKLAEDAAWLKRAGHGSELLDLAVAYWHPEGDEAARGARIPADGVPEKLALFADYLRIQALSEEPKPSWNAIVEQATVLLTNPRVAEALHLHGRLTRAASMAVRACVHQQEEELRGRLATFPYLKPATAQRHARLLGAVDKLPRETLGQSDRRSLHKGQALALASAEKPDWARVWAASNQAVSGPLAKELPLGETAARDACVRSYLKLPADAQRDPAASGAALEAALRLLDGMEAGEGLAEDTVVALYRELLAPLLEKLVPLRELARKAQPAGVSLADLERYHAVLGEFIQLHRFAPFTRQAVDHEKENAKLREGLFHWALYLHSKNPKPDKQTLADYYVQRGHARVELAEPDLEGALNDAEDALKLRPGLARAHGLVCHARLVGSRERLSLRDKLADLDGAIQAGLRAEESGSEMDESARAVLLLNLSYAHLERANFLRDPSFKRQKQDLQEALRFALEAAEIPQRYPEYPLIAQGHAYEDLAWIVEDEPEANYRKAVKAFQEAEGKTILAVAPRLGAARSLYKAVRHTRLDPRRLGFDKMNDVYAEITSLLEQCRKIGERLGNVDPTVLLYLGNVALVQERFDAAEEHFAKAWRLARDQSAPSRANFAVQWASFPLSNEKLKPDDRQAESLKRAASLADVPVAPGGRPDPAKEAALIHARVAQLKGDTATALKELDRKLPESVKEAGWSDFGLLLLRADIRANMAAEMAAESGSSEWDKHAASALADVKQAFDVAVTRFDLVGACQHGFLVSRNVYEAMDRRDAPSPQLPAPSRLIADTQKHLEMWRTLIPGSKSGAFTDEGLSDACERMALTVSKEAQKARPAETASNRGKLLDQELSLWKTADGWMERAADLTGDASKKNGREKHRKTLEGIIQTIEQELKNLKEQQSPAPKT